MFSSSAELYDLIYAEFKDYPAEAAQIADLIRGEHRAARTILDVACGTAEHARLLTTDHGFEVDGVDLDPEFVRIARGKLPGRALYQADMLTLDLDTRFDVVLCLFGSIGYVRTLENVTRALTRFRAHLTDGGVVLVEPWLTPKAVVSGRVHLNSAGDERLRVARMSRIDVEGRISRIHFEYLIGWPDRIEHASELHELGLFTIEEMLRCFRESGLSATFDPVGLNGRGLYLARALPTGGATEVAGRGRPT